MESCEQQHGRKCFAGRPPPSPDPGGGVKGQNSTVSEHGHVANQIKWNRECSNMQAQILFLHKPSIPWVRSKIKTIFF